MYSRIFLSGPNTVWLVPHRRSRKAFPVHNKSHVVVDNFRLRLGSTETVYSDLTVLVPESRNSGGAASVSIAEQSLRPTSTNALRRFKLSDGTARYPVLSRIADFRVSFFLNGCHNGLTCGTGYLYPLRSPYGRPRSRGGRR